MIKNQPIENGMHYKFILNSECIKSIYHSDICKTAEFRLDKPLYCNSDTLFVLYNGQWFIVIVDEPKLLAGNWVATI